MYMKRIIGASNIFLAIMLSACGSQSGGQGANGGGGRDKWPDS